MFGELDQYIAVFLVGLLVTYLLTPMVRAGAIRFGVVDVPDARRPHKRPTARGGGVAVVLGVHISCLAAIAYPWPHLAGAVDWPWWQRYALASLVLLVVGVVDDIRGMKPLIKLGGQVAAALIMWFSGTRFGQLLGHDIPVPLDCALVVIWLVAIINAFNLIDGLDGLASGLAIISAVGLCGIMVMQQAPGEVLFLFGFIGACLGFLRYNFNPASVFLGDTGSMFLGFTLGVVSLQTFNKNTFMISMAIPVMVLGIPIYDAMLAIWRRSVRSWLSTGSGGPRLGIMQPDVEHLHHRLSQAGLSTKRVASTLYLLNGGLVMAGLTIMFFNSHAAGIFLIALLAGVYVLMRHLAVIELRETGTALLMGLRRPSHSSLKALVYPVWDMAWLAGSLALIMRCFENLRVDFWHAWFLELPIWVTPTFFLLAMSRTYVTYWPRARLRDALMVLFWLLSGILLSLGLALIINPIERPKWLLRAVLIIGLSHPVIMGSWLIYRCLEELVFWLKRQTADLAGADRVLLYGAGIRAQLYLKDRATRTSKLPDKGQVVGFIDDEQALHFQWVYGFLVLGALSDLPRLIERYHISRVVIVTDLRPENRAAIEQMAVHGGITLHEWLPEEHDVPLPVHQP